MEASSPAIYARAQSLDRLSLPSRLGALAISLSCLAVLLVAAKLQPSPNGLGSPRQLGLQECQFESRTGLPCPTCGMTTSFAHFVRGQIPASLWVQPMGTLIALLTTMAFWAALYIAIIRPRDEAVRDALMGALKDENPAVQEAAKSALTKLK
jgi:hypothetical protein